MSKYSTIFFDWSGVVADDSGDEFIGQLLKNVGATEVQGKEITKTDFVDFIKGKVSEVEFWNNLKNKYNLKIIEPTSKEFKKWQGLKPNQDILKLIKELKSQGFRVALLTNMIDPTYVIIQKSGYYDLFDEVIASNIVGLAKPQKEIYELALGQLGTTAERSIFIDDKESNLEVAKVMGFKTILAQNPNQIINSLRMII